ncbi:phosphoribosyl-ATP pyrophosphohydrolase-like protein [Vibrio phage 1.188.A._10N.286.51.A6]|uniref:Phosphoribosyl-ATP pyrophosphohydrolase-like protein n=5 Tax=Mukerjeevirus TaxID=2733146 RepID=A0A2I7REF2_9CAUD|nr:phosphoribosyl-ATP pyrophosphohydrolase-like protein [Vibrio phage 1.169.O._10N.261.52.B1]YP_009817480.1 phosphoribosyl-ATP pyrophosphohydrolase-like protein [Vibrio phage 1.188.A._10N.286.51.A6]YP_009817622.1 phosphoribosyl-ATP pyrophosphohydrolase-like protein [Vibrio phage 1.224.A._10N.261.48.B1]AUR93675.1 phosphoribosyl-ATP pyrophosphohydrolase-like protein [Vibrio phage 1.188.B._10N.286.51.A6]AUR93761.1 phosphoribosyl-ATP pyrophosphohydrolase-like protein [Vibrio phage 1.188.C._10N.286.
MSKQITKASVQEFMDMGQIYPVKPTPETVLNGAKLIRDEVVELLEEYYGNVSINIEVSNPLSEEEINEGEAAGEWADIVYITEQQAVENGVAIHEAFDEKHRSNMSKVIPTETSNEVIKELLAFAYIKYPSTQLFPTEGGFVMKCPINNKLIKPHSLYSPAVMQEGLHYGLYDTTYANGSREALV